jgi:hypothetical protein
MSLPSGSCACGAVRYTCAAPPILMLNCHCTDCRRSSGAPFASGFLVPASALIVTGEVGVHETRGDGGRMAQRSFCPRCGSPLFAQSAAGDFVSIRAVSLDDATWFRPQMDCFVRSAQKWVALDPNIPKFDTRPTPSDIQTVKNTGA